MRELPQALPAEHTRQHAGATASTGVAGETAESWANGRNRTTPFGSARSVVMTKLPSSFATTKTVPSQAVRYTRAPAVSHAAITNEDGCPQELPAPTEITAACGVVA